MEIQGQNEEVNLDVDPRRRGNHREFQLRYDLPPYDMIPQDPNLINARNLHLLHNRTIEALYQVFDKTEQAVDIANATFEAWMAVEKEGGDIECVFEPQAKSNIFVNDVSGEEFFKEMKRFPSLWIVYDAFYQLADIITGRASCSNSDQQILFKMRWNQQKRHFLFISLDHVTDQESFPPPVHGRPMELHRYRLAALQ
ncbi:hypothetical protein B9Z55_022322 [Caenorhabditis nigoni]|nr:hypothetical protein B9Z55_022322 [Caenorhabditis nigoni]